MEGGEECRELRVRKMLMQFVEASMGTGEQLVLRSNHLKITGQSLFGSNSLNFCEFVDGLREMYSVRGVKNLELKMYDDCLIVVPSGALIENVVSQYRSVQEGVLQEFSVSDDESVGCIVCYNLPHFTRNCAACQSPRRTTVMIATDVEFVFGLRNDIVEEVQSLNVGHVQLGEDGITRWWVKLKVARHVLVGEDGDVTSFDMHRIAHRQAMRKMTFDVHDSGRTSIPGRLDVSFLDRLCQFEGFVVGPCLFNMIVLQTAGQLDESRDSRRSYLFPDDKYTFLDSNRVCEPSDLLYARALRSAHRAICSKSSRHVSSLKTANLLVVTITHVVSTIDPRLRRNDYGRLGNDIDNNKRYSVLDLSSMPSSVDSSPVVPEIVDFSVFPRAQSGGVTAVRSNREAGLLTAQTERLRAFNELYEVLPHAGPWIPVLQPVVNEVIPLHFLEATGFRCQMLPFTQNLVSLDVCGLSDMEVQHQSEELSLFRIVEHDICSDRNQLALFNMFLSKLKIVHDEAVSFVSFGAAVEVRLHMLITEDRMEVYVSVKAYVPVPNVVIGGFKPLAEKRYLLSSGFYEELVNIPSVLRFLNDSESKSFEALITWLKPKLDRNPGPSRVRKLDFFGFLTNEKLRQDIGIDNQLQTQLNNLIVQERGKEAMMCLWWWLQIMSKKDWLVIYNFREISNNVDFFKLTMSQISEKGYEADVRFASGSYRVVEHGVRFQGNFVEDVIRAAYGYRVTLLESTSAADRFVRNLQNGSGVSVVGIE